MEKGDRVIYSYIHNKRETVTTEWVGTVLGFVKHTKRYNGVQLVLVQFDYRNKASRVPIHKLSIEA